MFLTAENIKAKHGFFTREGGVSEGLFASLNCGFSSADNKEHIIRNRIMVGDVMKADFLQTAHQTHSDVTGIISKPTEISADALVTKEKGLALGVLTADCVPVLLEDAEAGVIGAAHAGWKGARFGIISSVVRAMHNMGAAEIKAAIGPAIQQSSYEVDKDFFQIFATEDQSNNQFFDKSDNEGKLQFDIVGYVKMKLEKNGVNNIEVIAEDTYSQPEKFYSYRRAIHNKEADYGRQISVICL